MKISTFIPGQSRAWTRHLQQHRLALNTNALALRAKSPFLNRMVLWIVAFRDDTKAHITWLTRENFSTHNSILRGDYHIFNISLLRKLDIDNPVFMTLIHVIVKHLKPL
jgi:hypothetical protein